MEMFSGRADSGVPFALVHLKLLFVAVTWGVGWTAGRVMALGMDPVSAAWVRYLIAVPLILMWMLKSEGWRIPTRKEWHTIMVIALFSTFLYQVFFMFGMGWTASGDASLVITFNPLFTALLAIPLLGRKMSAKLAGGLALGVGGIVVIFTQSPNVNLPVDERVMGDAFIALGALCWATATILMKKAMSAPATDAEVPMTPLALTVWASFVGLLYLTPWAGWETYVAGGLPVIAWQTWAAILFLAIGSTVISYVWFADGVRDIGAPKAALYVYLVPPFGIISGWALLDERLGWSLLLAFVLIVSGVALAQSEPMQDADAGYIESA